ncbi:hypothetical protein [Archangium sp.]|uniref:hypothetical protein n=1 Tax=Archangium sp. TaxID=1872627 RepID=UPI00389A09DE
MTLSRRMFVGSGWFGAASLTTLSLSKDAQAATLSCEYPTVSDSVRACFEAVASNLDQVIEKLPGAPGLNDLESLADIYPAEPGSEDDRLLQGALLLQAQNLFEMVAVPPWVEERSGRPATRRTPGR